MAAAVRLELTNDYHSVLRDRRPVIDVRSPSEFQSGGLSWAASIPILDDDARKQVGICYKERGPEAAIQLGLTLVSSERKEDVVQRWLEFIEHHPDAIITCWRGGLRSQIAQQWLADRNVYIPRLVGGTKDLRRFTLDLFESETPQQLLIVAGRTGVGKTKFLQKFACAIDLERLAHHRGSAFGGLGSPQPKPVAFEHDLASEILRTGACNHVLLEDESYSIGKLGIPKPVFEKMQHAPLVILDAPLSERVALIYRDYVADSDSATLLAALEKIQNRLGGLRYRELRQQTELAFTTSDGANHCRWIENLLTTYYDPMYDHQLNKKRDRVRFEGNQCQLLSFLRDKLELD